METPHLGTYMWTRNGEPRPMNGSQKAEEYAELDRQRKLAALATPEGQEWLRTHGKNSVWQKIVGDSGE